MSNEQFTPEELQLIDRLRSAPQPQLNAPQIDVIRGQLFQELDALPQVEAPDVTPLATSKLMIGLVVIVVIAIIGIVVVSLVSSDDETPVVIPSATAEISPSETSVATETLVITPTATIEPTSSETSVPTQTLAVTSSETVATPTSNPATTQLVGIIEAISGDTIEISGLQVDVSTLDTDLEVGMTISVSGTIENGVVSATLIEVIAEPIEVLPTATSVPNADSDVPILVIEGPVQTINIDYITIFDIEIQIDSADPVLTEIRLGDIIRVEGETVVEGGTIIIIAVNITIVQAQAITIIDPNAPAPAPAGLPANCRTNRSGRVTCRSRRS